MSGDKKFQATVSCEDARAAGFKFNCCGSCHEDDNEGYSPILERYANFDLHTEKHSGLMAQICCRASAAPWSERAFWVHCLLSWRQRLKADRMITLVANEQSK